MPTATTPSMFAVFRHRSFTLMWLAELAASMGSALTGLTASILVYKLTGSAYSVGMMLIATSGPTLIVGLLAGVFVDRHDRKRIMWVAYCVRAGLIALIPILLPHGIGWLFVLVALASAVAQFSDSAHASVLPEVAEDRELASANALMAISSAVSMTLGFAVAGAISSSQTVNWIFHMNALFFLMASCLIALTRIPALPPSPLTSVRLIGANLKAGLQFLNQTPILRSLIVVITPIFVVFGFQNSLLLPFSIRELGGTEFHYGLQQATETLGVMVGCILMARFADRAREGQWLAISYLGISVAMFVYTFCTATSPAIVIMGISGLLVAPSNIGRQLIIQRASPREMRGRVNSAFLVVRDITYVTGMALAGLADLIDLRILFLVSSSVMLLASVFCAILPGLGQSSQRWRQTLVQFLPGLFSASTVTHGRPATRTEIDQFLSQTAGMSQMTDATRDTLTSHTHVVTMNLGDPVLVQGEDSDSAYFILKGKVNVGYTEGKRYEFLNTLDAGMLFGEVAALTGNRRTADVTASADCEFLVIPSPVLRDLAGQHKRLKEILHATMAERLSQIELPRINHLDHRILKELRSEQPSSTGVSKS